MGKGKGRIGHRKTGRENNRTEHSVAGEHPQNRAH